MTDKYRPARSELDPLDPVIYVASLADYNAGRLHGTWLAATHTPDELESATAAMLAESSEPDDAEGWAIHDHHNFHGVHIDEHETFANIARLAAGIRTYGRPYALYAGHHGVDHATYDGFERSYAGCWATVGEFLADWIDGPLLEEWIQEAAPAPLRSYVQLDTDAYARDLALSGDLWTADDPDGVQVFWNARE